MQHWDKMDKQKFCNIIESELQKYTFEDNSFENSIEILHSVLLKASLLSVPSKTVSFKGQKWKASPKVRKLLLECKEKYQIWIQNGHKDDVYMKKFQLKGGFVNY